MRKIDRRSRVSIDGCITLASLASARGHKVARRNTDTLALGACGSQLEDWWAIETSGVLCLAYQVCSTYAQHADE